MDVELRHLRCLVAIAEEGTLTGAAGRLRVGQPAVSRTLAQLEALVGVRLVERSTRRLELTVDGAAFHRAALRALAAVDDALAAVHGTVRPLRIGYCWAAAGPHTTPILRAWRQLHPQIPVELNRHDERSAGLASGRSDLALVRVRLDPARYPTVELYREPRYVAMSDGDPLAGRPGRPASGWRIWPGVGWPWSRRTAPPRSRSGRRASDPRSPPICATSTTGWR